ncbi:hypothetical protein CHS0354_037596 [Potamilus streckersoni]|uniref:Uncharacterized protein n=1 Tax=Potamilus streckersoni TaxID=2493646 RepID=A0AAE0VKS6_9BIVA|nr:hypothetical protein CHS0354_037596 [Potamilus streckersoni]
MGPMAWSTRQPSYSHSLKADPMMNIPEKSVRITKSLWNYGHNSTLYRDYGDDTALYRDNRHDTALYRDNRHDTALYRDNRPDSALYRDYGLFELADIKYH